MEDRSERLCRCCCIPVLTDMFNQIKMFVYICNLRDYEGERMEKKTGKVTYILAVLLGGSAVIAMGVGSILLNTKLMWLGLMLAFTSALLVINVHKDKYRKPVMKVIAALMIFLTVVFLWGDDIFMALIPEPEVYEMTEEEKEWMKKNYIYDEESIEKGHLLPSQRKILEKGRAGLAFVEEKYPGYEFELSYIEDMMSMVDYDVKEKNTGYYFNIYIWENEDGTFRIEDNFYGYLFKDKYVAYLEEKIMENIEGICRVEATISNVQGREYDINMTVEDIVSGRLEISPIIHVSMPANGMTEEECMSYAETVQKEIEKIGLYGAYHMFFWDMTEEDVLHAESFENCVYKKNFSIFVRKGEEN